MRYWLPWLVLLGCGDPNSPSFGQGNSGVDLPTQVGSSATETAPSPSTSEAPEISRTPPAASTPSPSSTPLPPATPDVPTEVDSTPLTTPAPFEIPEPPGASAFDPQCGVYKDRDSGNDGTVDTTEVWQYRGEMWGGRYLYFQEENDGYHDVTWRSFDLANQLVRYDEDPEGDDVLGLSAWLTWSTGILVERVEDRQGDGDLDWLWWVEQGPSGEVVEELEDHDGDGDLDRRWAHSYDASLLHIRAERDDGLDGEVEEIETWAYNSVGQVVKAEHDEDGDGAFESITTSLYDEKGQLSQVRMERAGEEPDSTTTFTRDSVGRPLREALDRQSDGQVDWVLVTRWDSSGRLTYRSEDEGDDGALESTSSWTYEDGYLRRTEFWWAATTEEPEKKQVLTYGYDKFDRLIYTRLDQGGDDSVEEVWIYTYEGSCPADVEMPRDFAGLVY